MLITYIPEEKIYLRRFNIEKKLQKFQKYYLIEDNIHSNAGSIGNSNIKSKRLRRKLKKLSSSEIVIKLRLSRELI